jgi:NTP pyrophosphatase (non-canonical NTP hydrolase)
MDIQDLTQAMHAFVRAQGWYEADSPRQQTLRNLAISLNLEASEVLEHFQWRDELRDPESLAEELADVTLYLLQLASLAGIDLEQAVLKKLERNYHRKWDQDPPPDESQPGKDLSDSHETD